MLFQFLFLNFALIEETLNMLMDLALCHIGAMFRLYTKDGKKSWHHPLVYGYFEPEVTIFEWGEVLSYQLRPASSLQISHTETEAVFQPRKLLLSATHSCADTHRHAVTGCCHLRAVSEICGTMCSLLCLRSQGRQMLQDIQRSSLQWIKAKC